MFFNLPLVNESITQIAKTAPHGISEGLSINPMLASPFMLGLTVFVLAIFVGYYVIWKVTPALHSPLMAVTNAISSVIIVGALLAAGPLDLTLSKVFGFLADTLASINIFGGFMVTQRMLAMFKKKESAKTPIKNN